MAGGQSISGGTGALIAIGGDGGGPLTGEAGTSAPGTASVGLFLGLRSRKVGSGTASALLSGQSCSVGAGLVVQTESFALAGLSVACALGTLLYRGRATINWNENPEPDLAGYRVYHSTTAGGPYMEFVTLGLVTTYQWNGLLPGFTHYFAVTAYDTSNNESLKSLEVSKVY